MFVLCDDKTFFTYFPLQNPPLTSMIEASHPSQTLIYFQNKHLNIERSVGLLQVYKTSAFLSKFETFQKVSIPCTFETTMLN